MVTIDGVQYREVARKAKAGENIQIVQAAPTIPYSGYKNGDIFTVASNYGVGVISYDSGKEMRFWHSEYVVLEPVADEEVRAAKETAKWAAIGRKVGEFKVGDIVKQAVDDGVGYGVVTEVVEDCVKYRVRYSNGQYGLCWEPIRLLTLIAPVESVVNLRGGDAA